MSINQRQLQYLQVIAREGNAQRASRVLGKSPSTLTRTLRNLSEELEIPIFQRGADKLTPTPEGRQLLLYVDRLLEYFAALDPENRHDWTESEVRYLLTIREEKNISHAADVLYLSQPSLSETLLGLERELGQPLFRRSKSGVEETPYGTQVLDRLEEIRELYCQMIGEIKEWRLMRKGTVTIGIPTNLGVCLLPQILPEFCKKYPGVNVRILENNTADLERMLAAGKVDLCLMHDYEQRQHMEYETFLPDPFYLVLPNEKKARYRFPEDRALSAAELCQLDGQYFVMVTSRHKLRLTVDHLLQKAGVTPKIRVTTKNLETTKRLVAAELGASILPRSYLDLGVDSQVLACYPIDEQLAGQWNLVIAHNREEDLTHGARELLHLLRAMARRSKA